jgi:hypothetical protein
MKLLNVFAPKSPMQASAELFHRTWKICTRTVLRNGPRSVSWVIYADLDDTGELPRSIVAGGICDTEAQARAAMRRHFELWTLTGPTAMQVLGRAGW